MSDGVAAAGAAVHARSTLGALKGGDIVMLLVTVTVVLRVINFHYFKVPASIMMAFGSIACTVVLLLAAKLPFLDVAESLSDFRIMFMDFPDLVLNYMLGFLLFAAAIEVDLRALGRIKSTIIALSFFTTFISAFIVSALTYLLLLRTSPMHFAWCLLYGSIVSPTDPVAVISILNEKPGLLPSSTRYFVLGESLLNDAVGVVLYLVFSEIVVQPDMNYLDVCTLFFKGFVLECFTGIVVGIALAWIAYSAIKSVDETLLEIAITFVLVGNINMICKILNASIPLASVAAGLFIGNYCTQFAMSETTVDTFNEMWKLLDETLNSVLFLLIGFADLFWEPQEIGWSRTVIIALSTICISLFARLVSVACPLFFIIFVEWLTGVRMRHPSVRYRGGTIAVLTWGGMRGGISIALALGVPDAFVRHALPGHMTYGQLIFFMTFSLVVFSICVQGMFFEPVVRLINALSYEHFPSGGLGTYESRMNLNSELDESEEDVILHGDGGEQLGSSHHSWAAGVQEQSGQNIFHNDSGFHSGEAGDGDDDDDDCDDSDYVPHGPPLTPSSGRVVSPRVMPPKAPRVIPAAVDGGGSQYGRTLHKPHGISIAVAQGPPQGGVGSGGVLERRVHSFGGDRRAPAAAEPGGGLFPAFSGDRVPAAPPPDPVRAQRILQLTAADRHRREPSETFKGLAQLKQPPSIDEVWRGSGLWSLARDKILQSAGVSAISDGGGGSHDGDGAGGGKSSETVSQLGGGGGSSSSRDVGGALRRSYTVHGSDPSQHRGDADQPAAAAPPRGGAQTRRNVAARRGGAPPPLPRRAPPPLPRRAPR
jgi:monovalent cation:H+ antiporter, CPA1 family